MADNDSFTMSEAEVKRLRRGALLPALLILPMSAMFGLDQSKSQPMHFLMVFTVAIILAAAVVSISWYGAKRRIADFSHTILDVKPDRLIWHSPLGESELPYDEIAALTIRKVRKYVRGIDIVKVDGRKVSIEGFQSMDAIARKLVDGVDCNVTTNSGWPSI